MQIRFNLNDVNDYARFLKVKSLPKFRFCGRTAEFPDEYASQIGCTAIKSAHSEYSPSSWLFDYQAAITATAIEKRKYAIFADCGLGKTPMIYEFARHARKNIAHGKCILIVAPLMVVGESVSQCEKFYGEKIPIIKSADLPQWLESGTDSIGITNYDALDENVPQGRLAGLILDESSMLKSHYGKWGQTCIRLGKGLPWKLALTGTPAPNDRIEYANHAVFLDHFPTVNSFLAKYFVNRGETGKRWELKPHALKPFYRSLSHWCIFLTNPATYGWKDNTADLPPIHVHIHDVTMTQQQQDLTLDSTGKLFANNVGGIASRSVLSQIAKGSYKGESVDTLKPAYIKSLVDSWPSESTIIWCKFNSEQSAIAATFPEAANIDGSTPMEQREQLIGDFKSGARRIIISKPKILGFGLNLQIATRQVFSGLQDSYEEFYQAVKRSNRYGSKLPLNVHIPVTEIERPMIDTVLAKAKRVQLDAGEQEAMFRATR